LRRNGFSDLFVNVAGAGFSHCRAPGLPPSRLAGNGDTLAQCLAAAHAEGLRVHAWVLCFSTSLASPERLQALRQQGWLLTDGDRQVRDWVDPANPQARAHLVAAFAGIAERYPVDGLHLDFVRYPDFPSACGDASRVRFERSIGRRVSPWPDAVSRSPWRAEFIAWRCRQITDFVADVRVALRSGAPGCWLTAAVYGKYPSCVEAVSQAWETWIEAGLLDYAVPMNYSPDPARFQEWIEAQTRSPRQTAHLLPGIGVTAAESRLGADQTIDQILRVRAAGAPGFVLFDLDTTLEREILPILRLGLTAPVSPSGPPHAPDPAREPVGRGARFRQKRATVAG
jgi:uncharacterized lipoprotein YddW (UPF0748 family)